MQIAWQPVPHLNTPKRYIYIYIIYIYITYSKAFKKARTRYNVHFTSLDVSSPFGYKKFKNSPLARNVCFQGDQATGLGAVLRTSAIYLHGQDTLALGFANSTSQCGTKLHGLFLECHCIEVRQHRKKTLPPNSRLEFQSSFHM